MRPRRLPPPPSFGSTVSRRNLFFSALFAVGSVLLATAEGQADAPALGDPLVLSQPVSDLSPGDIVQPPNGEPVPLDGMLPNGFSAPPAADETSARLSNYYDPFGRQFA